MTKYRVIMTAAAVIFCAGVWSLFAHPWGWAFGIGVHPYPAGGSTPWTYQLLSGFVPALTALSLVTLLVGGWHHVNCHEPGCLRIGRHHVNGQVWCRFHHEKARPEYTDNELLGSVLAELSAIRALLERP